MKVYCVTYDCSDTGTELAWHASKREAERFARRIAREGDERGLQSPPLVEHVDVPTTRPALVKWLNDNLSTDNG